MVAPGTAPLGTHENSTQLDGLTRKLRPHVREGGAMGAIYLLDLGHCLIERFQIAPSRVASLAKTIRQDFLRRQHGRGMGRCQQHVSPLEQAVGLFACDAGMTAADEFAADEPGKGSPRVIVPAGRVQPNHEASLHTVGRGRQDQLAPKAHDAHP